MHPAVENIRLQISDSAEKGKIVMETKYLNLTPENLAGEHICCIIRSKKRHPGIEAKKRWLAERLSEGHVFRKLASNATVFIEYAPLETAWVPVEGDNYLYLYCLWVDGPSKRKGYGRALMEYCMADARKKGKSGICMLGSKRQKNWLSNQDFAKKFGFKTVDSTENDYELLALSFDGTFPRFSPSIRNSEIAGKELTIYYDAQCPFIYRNLETIKEYCALNNISISIIEVDSLQKAKNLPGVFNNFAVFYNKKFQSVNLLTIDSLKKILAADRV